MRACYERYDIVRMDHFRGFDEYYSIPAEDENAVGGHWEKGPGMELFHTLEQVLGERPVIAEDLGFMTPGVEKLVADSGYPNMKVIEFAFDERDTGNDLSLEWRPAICRTLTRRIVWFIPARTTMKPWRHGMRSSETARNPTCWLIWIKRSLERTGFPAI